MNDILFDEEITDKSSLEDDFIFHRTGREEARQILKNGFSSVKNNKAEIDEIFFKRVTEEENLSYPVDRVNSSFFYPYYDLVKDSFGPQLGTCLVVVDTSSISRQMWVADIEKYNSVISWAPMDKKRAKNGPYKDNEIKAVKEYLETITKASKSKQVQQISKKKERPEVIIEGPISKRKIVGVIMEKL